jgi:hypothetical protein
MKFRRAKVISLTHLLHCKASDATQPHNHEIDISHLDPTTNYANQSHPQEDRSLHPGTLHLCIDSLSVAQFNAQEVRFSLQGWDAGRRCYSS